MSAENDQDDDGDVIKDGCASCLVRIAIFAALIVGGVWAWQMGRFMWECSHGTPC